MVWFHRLGSIDIRLIFRCATNRRCWDTCLSNGMTWVSLLVGFCSWLACFCSPALEGFLHIFVIWGFHLISDVEILRSYLSDSWCDIWFCLSLFDIRMGSCQISELQWKIDLFYRSSDRGYGVGYSVSYLPICSWSEIFPDISGPESTTC